MLNGLLYDARTLPVELQLEAYLKGFIPYVPDLGRDGTVAIAAALRSGISLMELSGISDTPEISLGKFPEEIESNVLTIFN